MKVLNAPLKVSYEGPKCTTKYRAILQTHENLPILAIEQEIKGKWFTTGGSWYLGTLLEDGVNDGICIDGGLKWNVTQGMKGAINEALALCGGLEVVQKEYKAVFTWSNM